MSRQWKHGDIFHLTHEHLTLLNQAYVDWDDCEFGAPAINPKRPYGDSGVAYHIFEILKWPRSSEDDLTDTEYTRAVDFHRETQTALQIILGCRTFSTGRYRYVAPTYHRAKWEYIPDEDPVF